MLANLFLFFLFIHSYLRWAVVLLMLYALFRAVWSWAQDRPWTKGDRQAGLFYTISLDLQLTLGLLLYALSGFATSMRFVGEHIITMTLAVVFAHLGSSLPKKVEDDRRKHRRAAIWFALSVLVIIFSIPWSQPLLRGLGM
mgnify:CR=1 FL=1